MKARLVFSIICWTIAAALAAFTIIFLFSGLGGEAYLIVAVYANLLTPSLLIALIGAVIMIGGKKK